MFVNDGHHDEVPFVEDLVEAFWVFWVVERMLADPDNGYVSE
jgi:hypothetical protein